MRVLFDLEPERGIDSFEERADLRVPTPPEIGRDLLQGFQLVGKRVRHDEGSGVRSALFSFLHGRLHEEAKNPGGIGRRRGHRRDAQAFHRQLFAARSARCEGETVRLLVVLHEVGPVGQGSGSQTGFTERRTVVFRKIDELEQRRLERFGDFWGGHALAFEHSDACTDSDRPGPQPSDRSQRGPS